MIALIILCSVITVLLIFITILLVLVNKNLTAFKQDYLDINFANMKSISSNFEITSTLLDEIVHSQQSRHGKFSDDLDEEIIQRGRKALRNKK